MAKQIIGIGTAANDGTGDPIRTAFDKANGNFAEVYTGAETVAATAKTTPVDADVMPVQDSAAANVKRKVTWANIKATLKAYFDTLYPAIVSLTQVTGINDQVGTTYTLVLADAGKLVRCANVAAIALTVPPNSAVAIPVNTSITVEQSGAGVITITAGVGVTLNALDTGVKSIGQYAGLSLIKTGTDVWSVYGGTA